MRAVMNGLLTIIGKVVEERVWVLSSEGLQKMGDGKDQLKEEVDQNSGLKKYGQAC